MFDSLILRGKYSLLRLKNILTILFIITFLGNCTKEIISNNNTSEFSFSVSYFNYNNHTNKFFFYTEIENITNVSSIDSVWALLYNKDGGKIDSSQLNPKYPNNNLNSSTSVYSSVFTYNNLEPNVYYVTFNMQDQLGNHFESNSERKYLTTNTDPIQPEIINYSVPDTFILHLTEWTILPIELHVFDENGLGNINKVEYKVKSFFHECTEDNNGDGVITSPVDDENYTNYDNDDWLLIFNRFGPNNTFLYNVEIPMRPFNGLALRDDDGNIILGDRDKDCGGTGNVFFQFIITDQSSLDASIMDVHLEIIAP